MAADEGVVFTSGEKMSPGNFANSDIYSSSMGDHIKLTAGGESPTTNFPAQWYASSPGIHQSFDSLANVPNEFPVPETEAPSLLKASQGNAFVVENRDGCFTKGWIAQATETEVTIEYVPIP